MPPIRRFASGISESSECDIRKDNLYKKRKNTGRVSEVMKKLRLQTHEEGNPCQCKRLKCYENTTPEERKHILYYSCARHRSRKPENANFHQGLSF